MNTRLMIAVCLLFGFAASAAEVPEPETWDVVFLWDGSKLSSLERGKATPKVRKGQFNQPVEVKQIVLGDRSPVRIATRYPVFIFRRQWLQGNMELIRFKIEKGNRVAKIDDRTPLYDTVTLDQAINGASTRLMPAQPLSNGEYCFSPDGSQDAFCFGIDEPLVPEDKAVTVATEQARTPALTNDDVVKMAGEGLSADVIVALIRTKPARFVIDAHTVSEMKRKGVDNSVILAMIEKR